MHLKITCFEVSVCVCMCVCVLFKLGRFMSFLQQYRLCGDRVVLGARRSCHCGWLYHCWQYISVYSSYIVYRLSYNVITQHTENSTSHTTSHLVT